MKVIKTILTLIFDPISSIVSRSFPDYAYKFCNKNIIFQIVIAIALTLLIIFIGR